MAASAANENHIGVCVTVTTGAGRRAAVAAVLRPAIRLGCVRVGARRTMLLAREIGTTLLFIRSPDSSPRDAYRQHLLNREQIPQAASRVIHRPLAIRSVGVGRGCRRGALAAMCAGSSGAVLDGRCGCGRRGRRGARCRIRTRFRITCRSARRARRAGRRRSLSRCSAGRCGGRREAGCYSVGRTRRPGARGRAGSGRAARRRSCRAFDAGGGTRCRRCGRRGHR